MKKLYLVRHAKSSWKDMSLDDFDRSLNKRGKRDAPFMAMRLSKYKVEPDILISSPAKRARKTAKTIATEIKYPANEIVFIESIYGGGGGALFALLQDLDDRLDSVMLVGHNPDLTMLAEFLSGKAVGNIPTCGIFCMQFDLSSWKDIAPGSGSFIFFDYPKKHLGKNKPAPG